MARNRKVQIPLHGSGTDRPRIYGVILWVLPRNLGPSTSFPILLLSVCCQIQLYSTMLQFVINFMPLKNFPSWYNNMAAVRTCKSGKILSPLNVTISSRVCWQTVGKNTGFVNRSVWKSGKSFIFLCNWAVIAQSVQWLAMGWTIGVLGFDSRRGLGIFFFTTASRPALGPPQPPIQWVSGTLSLGVKQPGRDADHSLPSSAEVKEWVELYFHSPNTTSWHRVRLKTQGQLL
jgi:hypothetical protein